MEGYGVLTRFEQFALAINNIYQDMQKIQRLEMRKYGLKGPHAQCLMALDHFPEGITAAELCQIFERDKAAVSRTVAELEQMELILRTCPGGSRYRAKLALTPRGREIAQSVSKTAELAVTRAGIGVTEQEARALSGILNRVSNNLHEICKEGLLE